MHALHLWVCGNAFCDTFLFCESQNEIDSDVFSPKARSVTYQLTAQMGEMMRLKAEEDQDICAWAVWHNAIEPLDVSIFFCYVICPLLLYCLFTYGFLPFFQGKQEILAHLLTLVTPLIAVLCVEQQKESQSFQLVRNYSIYPDYTSLYLFNKYTLGFITQNIPWCRSRKKNLHSFQN